MIDSQLLWEGGVCHLLRPVIAAHDLPQGDQMEERLELEAIMN